jgi:1,4-alpha-glucan branching enzyme
MKRTLRSLIITLLLGGSVLYAAYGQMERDVSFRIVAPDAGTVVLYGSFDGWARAHPLAASGAGVWQVTVKMRRGRHEYKFLVDDQWKHNPELPVVDDGFSGKNNILIVR